MGENFDQTTIKFRDALAQVVNNFQLPLSTKVVVLQNVWLQLEVILITQLNQHGMPPHHPKENQNASSS